MSKWSRVTPAVSRFGFCPFFGIYLRGAQPQISAYVHRGRNEAQAADSPGGRMNNEGIKEVLNELFSHLERLETQNEAILQFLKEKKRVTEKQLAPYLEQAGNASSVRWRAARVRIDHLLEPEHPEKEIKLGKRPELHKEASRAESSDSDSVAALVGDNEAESSAKDGKKEKPAAAKAAQARPADGKADKPEDKSEIEQKITQQAAQDQHEHKSESIHHPAEATAPLGQKEGNEPAAQLKSDKTNSEKEAA
ncbi:MAG TPA: hypothetical protein VKV30_08595 [Candidatus Angelobacter sp.]|nr:hypothetical protein [Candidatus Angelobacter sp.]